MGLHPDFVLDIFVEQTSFFVVFQWFETISLNCYLRCNIKRARK